MEGALQDLEAAQADSARRLTASFAGALTDVEMSLQARGSSVETMLQAGRTTQEIGC